MLKIPTAPTYLKSGLSLEDPAACSFRELLVSLFLGDREKMPTETKKSNQRQRFPRRRQLTRKNFEKLKKDKQASDKAAFDNDIQSPQRLEEEIRSLCRSLGQEATVHLLKVLLQFQEKSAHPVR